MQEITFANIYTLGNVVLETDLYKQYHYPEMLIRYDSNFIEFKKMPSLDSFMELEGYLRKFHEKHGQKHVKFTFPDCEKPTPELFTYFKEKGYDFGYIELYEIEPKKFPAVDPYPNMTITPVTSDLMEAFLKLQYEIDLEFGEEFAKQKANLHKRNFESDKIMQVIALYKGIPAGAVDIIISENVVEIDSLHVMETFQRKGLGSRIQKFVMDNFPDRKVILVADGEDTPREMYRKQNYNYGGYKYEAVKVY